MKNPILPAPQSTIPLFYSKYVGYIVGLGIIELVSEGSQPIWIKFLYVFHLIISYISSKESINSYLFTSKTYY